MCIVEWYLWTDRVMSGGEWCLLIMWVMLGSERCQLTVRSEFPDPGPFTINSSILVEQVMGIEVFNRSRTGSHWWHIRLKSVVLLNTRGFYFKPLSKLLGISAFSKNRDKRSLMRVLFKLLRILHSFRF
ncbi:hypothetical protein HNY73_002300 [Argiope bruennichi]|uniref:Uncharacterized protein n=1 Tax=Argiope bruennichi TaxID=94029 RepID=A0A8T0FVR5_ARGBR|nr:hypothetical protein HNY73_002300 [Argiope bruennichi]